jgi:hypothetical protein
MCSAEFGFRRDCERVGSRFASLSLGSNILVVGWFVKAVHASDNKRIHANLQDLDLDIDRILFLVMDFSWIR